MSEPKRRPSIQELDTSHLYEAVKAEKVMQGLTNQQLADLSGVPQGYTNRFLAGAAGTLNLEYVAAYCITLGLSMDDLLGLPQTPPDGDPSETQRLQSELTLTTAMLGEKEKHIKMMQDGIKSRRTLIYGLTGLCILLAAALSVYVILDALNPQMGLIRSNGINMWVYLAALAIIGTSLFIGHAMVKKRLRRKNEHENAD